MDKVLILGAKGTLGQELSKLFPNGMHLHRKNLDVNQIEDLKLKIKDLSPVLIINCVAYNDVDGAEENRDEAFRTNAELVGHLAEIANKLNIPLVHFSTNYVFDGEQGEYDEASAPHPISTYAESKYRGEQLLQEKTDKFYLIRTSVVFGQKGESASSKRSFVDLMLDLSQKTDTIKAITDEVNSVTYVKDLALAVKNIVTTKMPYGIYHITNSGSASWYDIAKEIFSITGKNINVVPVTSSEFPRKARRPKKALLINTRLPALRSWQAALKEYLNQEV